MDISTLPSHQIGKYTIFSAVTPAQKQRGLQFVSKLPARHLLIFPNTAPGGYFHTVNCAFPLDLVILNSQNIVIDIWTVLPNKRLVGPTPLTTDSVVEGNAGWARAAKLKVGANFTESLQHA